MTRLKCIVIPCIKEAHVLNKLYDNLLLLLYPQYIKEPLREKTCLFPFSNQIDTTLAVQLHKMAKGTKFRLQEEERLYYLCSENKGTDLRLNLSCNVRKPDFCICENKDADQLRGNREADQRLCFRYTDSTIPPLPKSEISSL